MRPLNDYFLQGTISSLASGTSCGIAVPDGGTVIRIISCLSGAITATDAIITTYVNATAITGGAITIANSGSAAGDLDTVDPTGANAVKEGDYLWAEVTQTATNAVPAWLVFVIRR